MKTTNDPENTVNDRLVRYTAVAWSVILFYFSVIPLRGLLGDSITHNDKLLHFIAYMVLAFLFSMVLDNGRRWIRIIFTLILSVGYGILLELFQGFLADRDSSVLDAVYNTLGAVTGVSLFLLVWRIKSWRK